jgi:hypothetical protein
MSLFLLCLTKYGGMVSINISPPSNDLTKIFNNLTTSSSLIIYDNPSTIIRVGDPSGIFLSQSNRTRIWQSYGNYLFL